MKKIPKVAIHFDNNHTHSTYWGIPWVDFCKASEIPYKILNCYSPNVLDELRECKILLWHFSHYSKRDMTFARSLIYSAKLLNIKVFPDFNDCWHFDDKIAQDFFLQTLGCSIPKSKIFHDYKDVIEWLDRAPELPVVAKLRCGSGSQNVKLITTRDMAIKYAKTMFFGAGFSSVPSIAFKTKSNILSIKTTADIWRRAKRIPDFINTLRKSRSLEREKGYFYVQELIPHSGYDLKIVVIGEKLSFIGRKTRPNDFRASGGGDLFYDKSLVTQEILDLCFSTNQKMGSICMGFDVVVDKNSGIPYIIEMSYGFSHSALINARGYWNRKGIWFNEPLDAPKEILKKLI